METNKNSFQIPLSGAASPRRCCCCSRQKTTTAALVKRSLSPILRRSLLETSYCHQYPDSACGRSRHYNNGPPDADFARVSFEPPTSSGSLDLDFLKPPPNNILQLLETMAHRDNLYPSIGHVDMQAPSSSHPVRRRSAAQVCWASVCGQNLAYLSRLIIVCRRPTNVCDLRRGPRWDHSKNSDQCRQWNIS